MTDRTGHCLCGAVRFTATDAGDGFGVCHCKMCQRWTGFALAGIMVRPEQLSISGAEHIGRWRSSDVGERQFCSRCGASLFFVDLKPDGTPDWYEIMLGLLDQTSGLTLQSEIFTDRRVDGWTIAGNHQRYTEAEWFARKDVIPTPTETGQ